jgi:hypothetical protein
LLKDWAQLRREVFASPGLICCRLSTGVPAWKYGQCRMTLKVPYKHLNVIDSKTNSLSFDGGDFGLGITRGFCKLILAELL